jgi:hypothetical protein
MDATDWLEKPIVHSIVAATIDGLAGYRALLMRTCRDQCRAKRARPELIRGNAIKP